MKPTWFPKEDWSGDVVAIVAGGPSVRPDDVLSLQGRAKVIAVNRAMVLAPWADVCYAADGRWWETYEDCRRLPGIKITTDENVGRVYPQINVVQLVSYSDEGEEATKFVTDEPGIIAHGGNSGHQAINLALQFGARKMIWMGFDLVGKHWHPDHPLPLRNPKATAMVKWKNRLDSMSGLLEQMGCQVVNLSKISSLENYKKVDTLDEALAALVGDQKPTPYPAEVEKIVETPGSPMDISEESRV